MSDLWKNTNYISDDIYTSGRIVEYDLKSANINVLKSLNLISQEYYDYTKSLPKEYREREIGLLIKDRNEKGNNQISKQLADGIANARRQLFESNDIKDEEVVRIANDAVYINRSYDLKYTQFGEYIVFRPKSKSFGVLKLSTNLLIFLSYVDRYSKDIDINVKGISEDKLSLHRDYMLNFIGNTIYYMEQVGLYDSINFFLDVYKAYINRKLPIGFYREFDSMSCFNVHGTYLTFIDESNINNVDINYNLYLMRRMWAMLLDKYKIIL